MCAYDGQNGTLPAWPHPGGKEPWGVPLCLHPNLQTMLRGRLGFAGYVISDEGSITFAGPGYHDFTPTVRWGVGRRTVDDGAAAASRAPASFFGWG